ncbi:hypothetical protein J2S66_002917 [Saccharothrix longispora]|uniref:Uncharacterized protein n=1 Tax=Saccharothrix longispora TaxID=33920 RepID=A0ABU1PV57_9PSEU|nr:hypothetical protein [Saccharothrix longispora]
MDDFSTKSKAIAWSVVTCPSIRDRPVHFTPAVARPKLTVHRRRVGSRWRIDPVRHALLVFTHLRRGDTCTRPAAGSDIGPVIRLPLPPQGGPGPCRPRTRARRDDADRRAQGSRHPRRHPAAHRPHRRRPPVLARKAQAPRHERPSPDRSRRATAADLARAARLGPRPHRGPHPRHHRRPDLATSRAGRIRPTAERAARSPCLTAASAHPRARPAGGRPLPRPHPRPGANEPSPPSRPGGCCADSAAPPSTSPT